MTDKARALLERCKAHLREEQRTYVLAVDGQLLADLDAYLAEPMGCVFERRLTRIPAPLYEVGQTVYERDPPDLGGGGGGTVGSRKWNDPAGEPGYWRYWLNTPTGGGTSIAEEYITADPPAAEQPADAPSVAELQRDIEHVQDVVGKALGGLGIYEQDGVVTDVDAPRLDEIEGTLRELAEQLRTLTARMLEVEAGCGAIGVARFDGPDKPVRAARIDNLELALNNETGDLYQQLRTLQQDVAALAELREEVRRLSNVAHNSAQTGKRLGRLLDVETDEEGNMSAQRLDDLAEQLRALQARVEYLEGEDGLHTVADSKALAAIRTLQQDVAALQQQGGGVVQHIHPATWQCQRCGMNKSDLCHGACADCWAAEAMKGGELASPPYETPLAPEQQGGELREGEPCLYWYKGCPGGAAWIWAPMGYQPARDVRNGGDLHYLPQPAAPGVQ